MSCLCNHLLAQTNVLTQHNDVGRTGQNLSETILTPASVSSGTFGKLFSLTVDGAIQAQPLYVSALAVGGASHNAVFVATGHDSVYAFDADTAGAPLWQITLLDAAHGAASGATPVPSSILSCGVANSEYGVSGTPVIDPATNTLYVASETYENGNAVARIHALDLTTGNEKFGGPTAITASLPGTGSGSSGGNIQFNAAVQNQRAGLALMNGVVYIAFGAYCDLGAYHGWLFGYDAAKLTQKSVFITTPNGVESGIWMGGAAPAFDVSQGVNRMFVTTGNGTYDATTPYAANTMDYSDNVLRFDLSSGMQLADAFTPFNQFLLQSTDTDLGSSGALILPDQSGPNPHLLVEAGKGGTIYLVNRDSLGGYNTASNQIVQEIDNQLAKTYGLPAYWNGNIYYWSSADHLKQFTLTSGVLSSSPVTTSQEVQLSGLGSMPSISANAATNAIVWSLDTSQPTQILYAHDATNVANLLWSSSANPTRDAAGTPFKFYTPTIANGKVYVPSVGALMVYGLPDFTLSASTPSVNVSAGQSATDTLNAGALYGFTGSINLTCSVSGALAGVTCSIPATAPIGAASAMLTINTTASARNPVTLRRSSPPFSKNDYQHTLWYALALIFLLLTTAVSVKRRAWRTAAIFSALVLVACFSSCHAGGASSSSTAPATTAVAETGMVTIFGTAGTQSHSVSVSVSVQ